MTDLYLCGYAALENGVLQDAAIAVSEGRIAAVGPAADVTPLFPEANRIDWSAFAAVPGAVNAHSHSFQSLLRGMAVDRPFLEWRDEALYRHTPLLDPDTLYAGALLAFGEMLTAGVTTVADFFYVHGPDAANDDAVIRAALDLGVRLVFARTMYDWPGAPEAYRESVADATARTRALAVRYAGHPLVSVHPAPHSPHAASSDMIRAGHGLARELGTPYHIHVAEEPFEVEETLRDHGLRPVHWLDSLGVVDSSMIAVHLVWLDPDEIALLGARGAALAYCPSSNMFLADGVTRLPDLLAAGVRVGLGTDGGCSNNRTSVFEEMRMAALLQKVSRLDATCISAPTVWQLGTSSGADLLRLPVGRIAPGKRADLVAVDPAHLSLQPFHPSLLVAHAVYSMQPGAIRRVVVEGREVVRDGRILTVPAEDISALVAERLGRWPLWNGA